MIEGGKEGRVYVHLLKITEVVPGRRLQYSWQYKGYEGLSYVTFELFAEGDKTRLRLTHEGLETFPQEVADLKRVIEQYPQSRDARRELGISYYQQHNYDAAMEQFENAETHHPLWNAAQRQLREGGLVPQLSSDVVGPEDSGSVRSPMAGTPELTTRSGP